MRLAHGVGINDKPNYWESKEYIVWNDMLRRCFSEKYHTKKPTYIGCDVSENFKYFSYFYDWCNNQIGFGLDSYQLDKDLLIKGSKVYSEDICLFIPSQINSLIIKCDGIRGEYPIGVTFHKRVNKFSAKMRLYGDRIHIGYYSTPYLAFLAYKKTKENHIKEMAEIYRHSMDIRAYNALMRYTVDITD